MYAFFIFQLTETIIFNANFFLLLLLLNSPAVNTHIYLVSIKVGCVCVCDWFFFLLLLLIISIEQYSGWGTFLFVLFRSIYNFAEIVFLGGWYSGKLEESRKKM